MVHNRNKLIELFIGNIANYIVHGILEKAADSEELSNKYSKELMTSFGIAKKYREKINPIDTVLPDKDIDYIKNKIKKKVKSELLVRISKGYENIDLNLVNKFIDGALMDTKVLSNP